MEDLLPFTWEEVQRYFPPERVAALRQQLVEEHRRGATVAGLAAKYRMSRTTVHNTPRRYKEARELRDFLDQPKAPKNPHRKVTPEHVELVRQMWLEEKSRLKGPGGPSWPN